MITYKQAWMQKQAVSKPSDIQSVLKPEHNPNIPAPPVFNPPENRNASLSGFTGQDYGYQKEYDAAKAAYDKQYADWDAKYGEAYRAPYNPPAPEWSSLPKVKLPSVNVPNPVAIGKNVLRSVGNAAINKLIKQLTGMHLK